MEWDNISPQLPKNWKFCLAFSCFLFCFFSLQFNFEMSIIHPADSISYVICDDHFGSEVITSIEWWLWPLECLKCRKLNSMQFFPHKPINRFGHLMNTQKASQRNQPVIYITNSVAGCGSYYDGNEAFSKCILFCVRVFGWNCFIDNRNESHFSILSFRLCLLWFYFSFHFHFYCGFFPSNEWKETERDSSTWETFLRRPSKRALNSND